MYIYTQDYLEPKDSVFLTAHIENYHLARHMRVWGQQPSCLFSGSCCSSFENLEVLMRPECSSAANIKAKICLSEATGACNQTVAWVAFQGTALQKTLLFRSHGFTMLEDCKADWFRGPVYGPSTLDATWDKTERDATVVLRLLTSHIAKSVSH